MLKKLFNKLNEKKSKVMIQIFKIVTLVQCLSVPIYTRAINDTTLVTGSINLMNDATTVALIIEATLVVFLEIVTGIKYQIGEQEEKGKCKKDAKNIIWVGILIVSATVLIKAILSYFA